MGGREDQGVGVRAVERVDADAVFVDRHPDDLQAGRARERKRVVVADGSSSASRFAPDSASVWMSSPIPWA